MLRNLGISEGRAIELIRPVMNQVTVEVTRSDSTQLLDRFALVCLSNLVEPGDRVAKELCWQLGPQNALSRLANFVSLGKVLSVEQLPNTAQLSQSDIQAAFERWQPRFSLERFRKSFDLLSRIGCELLSDQDLCWPAGLGDLGFHAPLVMYSLGKTNFDPDLRAVALVGSRAITPYGRWVTKDFTEALVGSSRPVISGGAFGVDSVAHQTALSSGGLTVAVMAGGLDQFYPVGNIQLLTEIRKTGTVLAEVPPGFAPTKWRFLQRNRLIAAMSRATLVVEAGYRSGSINTANHANELGREVGAVPGSVNSSSSIGCHELIRNQKAKLIATPKHLLELLETELVLEDFEERLSSEQTRVLDAMGSNLASEDSIAIRAGMSHLQCQLTLAQLELEGLAVRKNLKWRRSSRNL